MILLESWHGYFGFQDLDTEIGGAPSEAIGSNRPSFLGTCHQKSSQSAVLGRGGEGKMGIIFRGGVQAKE